MRLLIIYCHPCEESFVASVFARAVSTLEAGGHDVRSIDLYSEGFDPVLGREEWQSYFSTPEKNIAALKDHTEALTWADGLVLIFPTWMYGPPAMLKGWLERVSLPGIAFDVAPEKNARIVGKLNNIKRFCVITTSGSPRWWLRIVRDPGRNFLMRGMRIIFSPACKVTWLQLYDMDHASDRDRTRFLDKVEKTLSKF
ncbi:NAD(P)H-dependent oxidoreductase [Nitratireductor sp. XY-223]|uniref:NAD(P)H-dependent oxidoreductase n=1 Tax=Nitratireductor sp. XY-223 TaxID=2561926 RepID=UPI00145B2FB1|nr:NAD(P)H-dependent oxidoreductase [Nitratireductor sp. XY-223]